MKEKLNLKLIGIILSLLIAVPVLAGVKVGLAEDDDDEREYSRSYYEEREDGDDDRQPENIPPAPIPSPTPTPTPAPVPAPSNGNNNSSGSNSGSQNSASQNQNANYVNPPINVNLIIQEAIEQEKKNAERVIQETVGQERTKYEQILDKLKTAVAEEKEKTEKYVLKLLDKIKQLESPAPQTAKVLSAAVLADSSPAKSKIIKDSDGDGVTDDYDTHPGEDDFAYLVRDDNANGLADDLEIIFLGQRK